MNGICSDLVQALQSSRQNEGDSERLRMALNGMDLLAVDPAGETLMVMRAASVHVKNGRPRITMICQRVATGNEYRDWQQSGSVPQIAGDAGSNPAVGAFYLRQTNATAQTPPDFGTNKNQDPEAADPAAICSPCPFCGGRVGYVTTALGGFRVVCDECDIHGPRGNDYNHARERWNRRANKKLGN